VRERERERENFTICLIFLDSGRDSDIKEDDPRDPYLTPHLEVDPSKTRIQ